MYMILQVWLQADMSEASFSDVSLLFYCIQAVFHSGRSYDTYFQVKNYFLYEENNENPYIILETYQTGSSKD